MLAPAGGSLFTGGIDIDPICYMEIKRPCCGHTDCDLDSYQLAAFRTVLELGKPILGICRGWGSS
jgi:putative glutamine amidotransferase